MGRVRNIPVAIGHDKLIDGITPEQEAYARARAQGMSIEDAIIAANVKSAAFAKIRRTWEAHGSPVKKRILLYTEQIAKNAIMKTGLDRAWVIERLMGVVDRCMQAEPVLDKDGEPTGEYKFDSGGANRALQLLGMELGMYKPQEEKPGDEYANLSDEDITRIAAELATQTGLVENLAGEEASAGSEQARLIQAVPETD